MTYQELMQRVNDGVLSFHHDAWTRGYISAARLPVMNLTLFIVMVGVLEMALLFISHRLNQHLALL